MRFTSVIICENEMKDLQYIDSDKDNNVSDTDNDIHLALQCDAEHLLVGPDAGQGGAPGPRPPVFLNPLPVIIILLGKYRIFISCSSLYTPSLSTEDILRSAAQTWGNIGCY